MAQDNFKIKQTFLAGEDLSAARHKFVKITSANTVSVCDTLGEMCVGVNYENPSTVGDSTGVVTEYGCKVTVLAGVAVAAGSEVSIAATGKAKVAATGEYIVGTAIDAAAADGDYFTMLFQPTGPKPA
jgi:hypothetical protein